MQIKLLTLDSSGYALEQQYQKVKEEFEEVKEAYCKNNVELIAETLDLMQACKTLLEILERDYQWEADILSHNNIHIAKLKQRAAMGKIKLMEDCDG
jgi:hypothetical protein